MRQSIHHAVLLRKTCRMVLLSGILITAIDDLYLPRAFAQACVPSNQVVTGPIVGPIDLNGGSIAVVGSASLPLHFRLHLTNQLLAPVCKWVVQPDRLQMTAASPGW